jgi:hypothetical protein
VLVILLLFGRTGNSGGGFPVVCSSDVPPPLVGTSSSISDQALRDHGPLVAGPFPVVEQSSERDESGIVRASGPLA